MNATEANQLANEVSFRCRREWSDERIAAFTADLLGSSIGVVPVAVVADALRRLLEDVDPDAITLHKLVEAVKTRPVHFRRPMLPEPASVLGPMALGIIARRRAGIPDPPANLAMRAELEAWFSKLGGRMRLRCDRCGGGMSPEDVLAYVRECMRAGRECEEQVPPRECGACVEPEVELEECPF